MTPEREAQVAAVLPALVRDLVTLAGVGMLSYGCWLVFPPAGFICCGALMLLAGIVASRAAAIRNTKVDA